MTARIKQFQADTIPVTSQVANTVDARGYEIFSRGETGQAHALAHRVTDSKQWTLGHQLLGEWLRTHNGQGSEWVHLHFHMAIFELKLGNWNAAYRLFIDQILPASICSTDALTDAPALLWRLALAAPKPTPLPWAPLRQTALAHLYRTSDAFVQLHNLLALAGAKDTSSIERWRSSDRAFSNTNHKQTLHTFALGMAALSQGSFNEAHRVLSGILPDVINVGGSMAQSQLFCQLSIWVAQLAGRAPSAPVYSEAA